MFTVISVSRRVNWTMTMRLVLNLLMFVILSAVAREQQFPVSCKCTGYGRHLKAVCSGLQWTELNRHSSEKFLNSTTKTFLVSLDLSNNLLTVLKERTFANLNLTQLEFIFLQDNNLQTINSDAFVGVEGLKDVDISGNKLRFIPPTMLRSNTMVRKLWLDNNPQLYLPPHGTFLINEHLKRLYVVNCNLMTLPEKTFLRMKGLTHINLSRNKLSVLPDNVFSAVVGLTHLDLSYNQFNTLSDTALLPLPGLTTEVDGNPWHCDCRLKALRELFIQRAWKLNIICAVPEELNGILWREVEDTNCATSTKAAITATSTAVIVPTTTTSDPVYIDNDIADFEIINQNITDTKMFGELKQSELILESKKIKPVNIYFSYFGITLLGSAVVFNVLVFVIGPRYKAREAKPIPMGLLEQGTKLI